MVWDYCHCQYFEVDFQQMKTLGLNMLFILGVSLQIRGLTQNEECDVTFMNLKLSGKELPGPPEKFLCSADRGLVCLKKKCVCGKNLVWDPNVDTPNSLSPFGNRFDGISKGDCRRAEGGSCYDGNICITGTFCAGADFVKKTEGTCKSTGRKSKKASEKKPNVFGGLFF
ncbi:unnamed protein product [Allacma fusca]|uniref:Uncharacterized protein n=1 Tax=Allacma fusca TaxID=39272 RepID=A0A8J2P361_9HEXA|nr:unnamed protein product [Allacma fusca]